MEVKELHSWFRRFWFLRGIIAAISVLLLLEYLFAFSRLEALRAMHACLVGWNLGMSWLGNLVGQIPFLPSVSANFLNSVLFAFGIGAPASYLGYELYAKGEENRLKFLMGTVASIYVYMFAAGILYYAIVEPTFVPEMTKVDPNFLWGLGLPLAGILLMGWVHAIIKLPGYGKGLLAVVTFFGTIEFLHFMPVVGEQISKLSDWILTRQN